MLADSLERPAEAAGNSMLQALIGPVAGLLDKFIEDKDQKAQLAHDIATMAERHMHEANLGQIEINKAEAQHRSMFVAGWRPFLGWDFRLLWSGTLSSFRCLRLHSPMPGWCLPKLPEFGHGKPNDRAAGDAGLRRASDV